MSLYPKTTRTQEQTRQQQEQEQQNKMGGKPTKRQSKETKQKYNEYSKNKIDQVNKNITRVQERVLHDMNNSNNSAIVQATNQQTQHDILNATLTAQTQLQRGGNALIKADMIAITMFLKTVATGRDLYDTDFSNFTRDDLVNAIRTTVYDPDVIFEIRSRSKGREEHGKQRNLITNT